MTLQIAILLLLLVALVVLFLTEVLAAEVSAGLVLAVLTVAGYLSPTEAFAGFSSPAVITVLSGFFLSTALQHTGVAEATGSRIQALAGDHEAPLIVLVMAAAALLSAFMPNIAATAVLMPTVAALAVRTRVPESRLFMPLAFGAVLGGTLTLVGTPPNVVAAEVLAARGREPFGLFTFTVFGLALVAIGIVFMSVLGRRWLPRRSPGGPPSGAELARVYRLDERLFSIRVPEGSALDGKSLREAELGMALNINVTARIRDGEKRLAPGADMEIRAGDILLVEGSLSDLEELLRMRGLNMAGLAQTVSIGEAAGLYTGVVLRVGHGSAIAGHTVQELRFQQRYGGLVVALWRDGERVYDRPGGILLEEGDELLALGDRDQVEELAAHPDFDLVEIGPPTLRRLQASVFQVYVTKGSALAGMSVRDSRMGELMGLTIVGRVPASGRLQGVTPDEVLCEGDRLMVSGEPSRVAAVLRIGDIEIGEQVSGEEIESEDVKVVEAIIAPRSRLDCCTLGGLDFRERYGLQVLALLRGGQPIHEGLADIKLNIGDALLLQGPAAKLALLAPDPDFLVLTPGYQEVRRTRHAPIALGALALMVALVAVAGYPIHLAAFLAALLVVVTGTITMDQAYRSVDWRTVLLVAVILPMGPAMERSGTALWIADGVVHYAGAFGPYAVLLALVVLSSLLTQVVTGAPTVVMLAPVAFVAAASLNVRPEPLMMGIALAASMAFLTPFSHKANLLVMSSGGYRATNFLRVGFVLTVLTLTLIILMVPWLIPF
jgi:di/tricarboxylate transporter